jgi:serine/threonine protein kinase
MAILKHGAAGLAAIHAAGIIHRDIKPNNMMLDGSGSEVKLCITDFGLARAHEAEPSLLGKGLVAGTPDYIAPELYLGRPPSQATDLFAFGVVLHEVFTGQKPARAPDNSSVIVSPRLSNYGLGVALPARQSRLSAPLLVPHGGNGITWRTRCVRCPASVSSRY